jgi:hypothetical protein
MKGPFEFATDFAGAVIYFVVLVSWLAGVVLASGWWKLLATLFPFYAWYLVVERAMQIAGFIGV